MQSQTRQPDDDTASTKPFNHRQATAVGIILIVLGGLSVLFNIVDLCVGTGMPDIQKTVNINSDGSLIRTMSHVSLGVAAHGFWAGGIVSD